MVHQTRPEERLVTADELFEMNEKFRELIRGKVVEMSPGGFEHSEIGAEIVRTMGNHVKAHGLGRICNSDCGFILERDPDTVRCPDAAFIRSGRVARTPRFVPMAPDLAVEVISPSDRLVQVREKVLFWLDHGTEEVWVIDPERRCAFVHRLDGTAREIDEDGAIEGGDLLPGFVLPLRELFAD